MFGCQLIFYFEIFFGFLITIWASLRFIVGKKPNRDSQTMLLSKNKNIFISYLIIYEEEQQFFSIFLKVCLYYILVLYRLRISLQVFA